MRVCVRSMNSSGDFVTGKVLAWTQTVEEFGHVFFQVPAVLLDTGVRVELIPLKKGGFTATVDKITE